MIKNIVTKKMLFEMNDIKRIIDFQLIRIKDEKAVNRKLVLRGAMQIIIKNAEHIVSKLARTNDD